ncbi:hypothetical protein [Rhodococcus opacus]|uniref:hypothetical protein n=1 Tax=Rhodococcus opacus TaxID=37919 RepID=UPI002948D154|nr:hypothetical protein [Rhodococcus opacus]MDV6246880.1 hypothetical protein [Rhodococcus opacus]
MEDTTYPSSTPKTPYETLRRVETTDATSPVWQIAKSLGVTEREALYILGLNDVEVFTDDTHTACVLKADYRGWVIGE